MVTGQIEPRTTSILSSSIENACHPVYSTRYDSIRADQIVRKLAIFLSIKRKWGSDLKKVPAHHVHYGGGELPIIAYTGRLSLKVVPFSGFRYMKLGISLLERVAKSVILACKKSPEGLTVALFDYE